MKSGPDPCGGIVTMVWGLHVVQKTHQASLAQMNTGVQLQVERSIGRWTRQCTVGLEQCSSQMEHTLKGTHTHS